MVKTGPNGRKARYAWVTVMGISFMLVTGCTLLDNRTDVGTVEPSSSVVKQVNPANVAYKQGEAVTVVSDTPLYIQRVDRREDLDSVKLQSYTTHMEKWKVRSAEGEWIKVQDENRGTVWFPAWYASKESRSIEAVTPQTFKLHPDRKLYLSPGSTTSWPIGAEEAFLIKEWNGWYGVSITPRNWTKNSLDYLPPLLWVKAEDIDQHENIKDGWLQQNSSLTTTSIRHLTYLKFNREETSNQVKRWLGEPDWKEHSSNLSDTGQKMSIGETWRYEREDSQFLVTFTQAGKIARTEWRILQGGQTYSWDKYYFSTGEEYEHTNKTDAKVLPATLPWKPIWTNQGGINYTFLQAANEDVLLMEGDDGGFSGFHYESSMYALDRDSGEKLWEVNAGYGIQQAQMDIEREHVTLFTDYDPVKKGYTDRVRQLRLNDGKVMWGFNPKRGYEVNYITAAKNVVVVDSRLSETSNGGHLSVLNSKNGKILWTRKLNKDYQLLNQRAEDPYVLYWDKGKLTAADPLTGRVVWNIVAKKSTVDHPENNPYFDGIYRKDPFQSAKPERWMLLADQWTLVDLNTGKKREHFAAKQEQQIEVLNDGMVLIRENKHGDQYGEYEDFTTTLYDPQRGQKRWSVNAKIERGLVEGDQVYVIRNGSPAALDYKTGKLRWSVKETLGTVRHLINQGSYTLINDQLLLPTGADLLVFNAQNGELIGRVNDIVTGQPEHRDRQAKNGAINRIGDEVYIGSSNGRFSLYKSQDLLSEMVQ
ncbi:hypothetical protein ASD24_20330 [Paenibacillus sp. Root52]|uniref:Outer membrane protein assembly factor BamB n=1 Tax=Paenibacillus amylolyticus TaxID=1451 RepID=A0AAP5H3Y0_PAEAM|nr:PQQ-binding-like beta-propeller repeat protein [Paenibacillus sp. Root52]KQY93521.1 hypothetical protein ASD24_20330 [Paenibacillus sp. Root52]MDR6725910.1 outer membrane protein assembly factor BamB [Paenibacillus amylolyticus]